MGDQGCQGKCIPDGWINDNQTHCSDGSDEQYEGNSLLNEYRIRVIAVITEKGKA
jgi:hypothetical protein